MNNLLFAWILFLLSALGTILAGTGLSINADRIAARTGLGRLFIGCILLSVATSLPELVTISSAALARAPDLAVGNLFGSYTINYLLLALLDLFQGRGPLLYYLDPGNILLILFGILLAAVSIFFMQVDTISSQGFSILWLGGEGMLLFLIYLSGSFLLYRYQRRRPFASREDLPEDDSYPLRRALFSFLILSLVILVTGITLALSGEILAARTGLGQSLVGTIFIAFSTSLPELITTLTAIRLGAYNLAVGNILGSNLLNIALIGVADAFYLPGPILRQVSEVHTGTALLGIILSIIAAISLFYRSQRTVFKYLGWGMAILVLTYLLGVYLLFF